MTAIIDPQLDTTVARLEASGLSYDEATIIAERRRSLHQTPIGVSLTDARPAQPQFAMALTFAVLAAVLIKFAAFISDPGAQQATLMGILVGATLTAYQFSQFRRHWSVIGGVAGAYVVLIGLQGMRSVNDPSDTGLLELLHLPVLVAVGIGLARIAKPWCDAEARHEFIRVCCRWAVCYALFALGGGALIAMASGMSLAVGVDAMPVLAGWVLPCGAAGATVIAAWCIDTQPGAFDRVTTLLSRVFTPLLALTSVVLSIVTVFSAFALEKDRNALTMVNLLLVAATVFVLYSGRSGIPPWLARTQLVLIGATVLLDVFALVAMAERLAGGVTANRVVVLGLNVVLLVGMVGLGALMFGRSERTLQRFIGWQTLVFPGAIAVWALFVFAVIPPMFGYR